MSANGSMHRPPPRRQCPAMQGTAPQPTNTAAELSTGCSPIESSKLFLSDEVHSNPLVTSSAFFHSSCFAIKWVPWWRQVVGDAVDG